MTTHATGLNREMLEFIAGTDRDTHIDEYRAALENAMDFFNVKGYKEEQE